MLLAIDIGNTNIVLGVIKEDPTDTLTPEKRILRHWRIGTSLNRTSDEYGTLIYSLFRQAEFKLEDVQSVVLCSVVPTLQGPLSRLMEEMFRCTPLIIGPGIKTGISILYDNPREVGADRIVNAIAAYHRFKKACIVADFGTATTFDYINAKGQYAGGVIAPGIAISAEALFHRASKLPRVDLVAPDRVIGRSTVGSIQSGLYYGYLGMVDRIIEEMCTESSLDSKDVMVIATGGLAPLIVQDSKRVEKIIPHLTLEGLEILHRINQ